MSSFLGFFVGLLQTTLSMLGLVQQHPELPRSVQDHATQAVQQAISLSDYLVPKPNALFADPSEGVAPLKVTFSALAYGDGYSLEFGDTNTDSLGVGQSPCSDGGNCYRRQSISETHTYKEPGTYTAKLQIGTTTLTTRIIVKAESNSVPGMSKYTDPTFGYSLNYPTGGTATSPVNGVVQIVYGNAGITVQAAKIDTTFEKWLYGDPATTSEDTNYSLFSFGGADHSQIMASTTLQGSKAVEITTDCTKVPAGYDQVNRIDTVRVGIYYEIAVNNVCNDPSVLSAYQTVKDSFRF